LSVIHICMFHVVFWIVTLSSVGRTFKGTYCHCLHVKVIWWEQSRLSQIMNCCVYLLHCWFWSNSHRLLSNDRTQQWQWHDILRCYCTSYNFIRKWTKQVGWSNNSSD
jgi:hypothetical protein